MSLAYYNEIDPYAAQWLRNLIAAGHIAPGVVDERSIVDVQPSELAGYDQCHFFAGIGVWSHALRLAGWDDSRPVWTGSCPCQPFSAAGKGDGFDDERHLWPAWHRLIRECLPPVVFGEQVASKAAEPWIDLVQDDMEAMDYAFGAVAFPSAGIGAPHIRDRTYWVADAVRSRGLEDRSLAGGSDQRGGAQGLEQRPVHGGAVVQPSRLGDDDDDARLEGLGRGHQAASGRLGAVRPVAEAGEPSGLADDDAGLQRFAGLRLRSPAFYDADGRGPVSGAWADADWIPCRDNKWRPVEPGTFPLAHGIANRVGRLRAYGNAIVPQAAAEWIRAWMFAAPQP